MLAGWCKYRVNWAVVCDAIGVLPWRSIWSADNPAERLNVHLSLLVERFVPTMVIRVRNKDKPWFYDDCIYACIRHQAGSPSPVDP